MTDHVIRQVVDNSVTTAGGHALASPIGKQRSQGSLLLHGESQTTAIVKYNFVVARGEQLREYSRLWREK